MSMVQPNDLVTLKEAMALTGKSKATIRRWRDLKGLEDHRDSGSRTAPSLFSKRQLLAVAGLVTAGSMVDTQNEHSEYPIWRPNDHQSEYVSGEVQVLRDWLADVKKEYEETKAELKQTRYMVTELERKNKALNDELNRGVAGLLVGKVARRFGL